MSHANHSITLRAVIPAQVGMLGRVMAAIGESGAEVGGVDIVRSAKSSVTRDITVYVRDDAHAEAVRTATEGVEGVRVEAVSDRVFQSHLGGMVGMRNRSTITTRDDLSMAYTPGVARVCMAIHHDFDKAWDYTIKANSVMVVSDGSSVVGQGDLGAEAALPAMEAKCLFLRELAGIDAFPLPLDTRDLRVMVDAVVRCSSVFAGIHLTDIAAPRCFELLRELGRRLEIPVFHDDQEGTAVALLAALTNGLSVAGKKLADATVVVAGLGPGGMSTVRILVAAGVGNVVACDSRGAVHAGRGDDDAEVRWVAEHTNPEGRSGSTQEALAGADAFIGLSVPNLLTPADVRRMAADPVVFALAMPEPEIGPDEAYDVAAVYATGRPDVPNQINSALAFPGIWRGALDCRATEINDAMTLAAAAAIAETAMGEDGAISPYSIVPSVLSTELAPRVAAAVRQAAEATGVARLTAAGA